MTAESEEQLRQPGRVYVLHVWFEEREGREWHTHRYILEDPFSKGRRGFADLGELTTFLASRETPPGARPSRNRSGSPPTHE